MSYQIIRYFRDDRQPRVMQRGLSLATARLHCMQPETKGDGWFDGYRQVSKRGRKPKTLYGINPEEE